MKKILVCGSRTYTDKQSMEKVLLSIGTTCEIIHGDARGADRLAKQICIEHGIPQTPYPADWTRYGKGAGPIRNLQMLDMNPDMVLAFFDGKISRGTQHTVLNARRRKIQVEVFGLE